MAKARFIYPLLFFVTTGLFGGGCHSDDDLGEQKEPTFELVGFSDLRLTPLTFDQGGRDQFGVTIRNSGSKDLSVSSLELVNVPSNFTLRHHDASASQACPSNKDTDCSRDSVCLNKKCFSTVAPTFPIAVPPNKLHYFNFALKAGTLDVSCVPAPEDVPANIKPSYCGEIIIKTNARTDNEAQGIKEGSARLFVLYNGPKGVATYSSHSIFFQPVVPSTTFKKPLKITNDGSTDLIINSFTFITPKKDQLSISDKSALPITLKKGETKEFIVTLTTKDSDVELEFDGSLKVETSAGTQNIAIKATYKEGPHSVFSLDKGLLLFEDKEESTATFTIKNSGDLLLTVTGWKITGKENVYTIKAGEEEISNGKTITVDKNSEKTITVTLKTTGSRSQATALLSVRPKNDAFFANEANSIFLGGFNDGATFAEIYPSSIRFNKNDGDGTTRDFLVRNYGDKPLKLTSPKVSTNDGNLLMTPLIDVTWEGGGTDGTVPAQGILRGTLTRKASATPIDQLLKVKFTADIKDLSEVDLHGLTGVYRLHTGLAIEPSNSDAGDLALTVEQFGVKKVGKPLRFRAPSIKPADAKCVWLLLKRPSTSKLLVHKTANCSNGLTVRPDVAGDYLFSTTLIDVHGGPQVNTSVTVEADN